MVGGQAIVENLELVLEHTIYWEVLQIWPTKYDRLSKDAL